MKINRFFFFEGEIDRDIDGNYVEFEDYEVVLKLLMAIIENAELRGCDEDHVFQVSGHIIRDARKLLDDENE